MTDKEKVIEHYGHVAICRPSEDDPIWRIRLCGRVLGEGATELLMWQNAAEPLSVGAKDEPWMHPEVSVITWPRKAQVAEASDDYIRGFNRCKERCECHVCWRVDFYGGVGARSRAVAAPAM